MMVGIVIDVFSKEHEEYNREHNEGEAGEVHQIFLHTVEIEEQLNRIKLLLKQHKEISNK
jgi:hypothetical protein